MRHIKKGTPPPQYVTWFSDPFKRETDLDGIEHKTDRVYQYEDLRRDKIVIEAVEQGLLQEQGFICCYTGLSLGLSVDERSFHVEHLKPQSHCDEKEDIDYFNLLAAYPSPSTNCNFGAVARGNWYDPDLMVSPLDPSCESRFIYKKDGTVKSSDPNHKPTLATISKLKLNHDELVDLRRAAIKRFFTEDLIQKQLEHIAAQGCQVTQRKKLPAFCFVMQTMAKKRLTSAQNWSKTRISKNTQDKRKRIKGKK
jgi:uncharacterized protein (TIGR02646 family)